MRLEGKIALITGAGSGIGRATTLRFLREGAEVVLCDFSEENLRQTEKEMAAIPGARYRSLQMDVRREADWQRVAKTVEEAYGKLHVFFNNAGILVAKPIVELTLEDFERQMAVNSTGAFLGFKYMLPLLEKSGNGSIINTASDAATLGYENHAAYGASKAAITMLSQVAACEYCERGVRSNSIHPAAVITPLIELKDKDITKDEGYITPMGRILQPEDVANLVVFLASDESAMINGSKLAIDGGATGFSAGDPFYYE